MAGQAGSRTLGAMLASVLEDRVPFGVPRPYDEGLVSLHTVQFYESDEFLCSQVAEFVATGLAGGEAAVVVVTAAHASAISRDLVARCIDVAAARGAGRLLLLDARETLSRFMVDGQPDPERFRQAILPLLDQAARATATSRVRAFGEMVDLLCRDGMARAAIDLERLWSELAGERTFALLCGYSMESFADHEQRSNFQEVCAHHHHVLPAESYAALSDPELRAREITTLQQRARCLESEIEKRKQTEASLLEALRARDDFLAIASHELRTPVTALTLELEGLVRRARASEDAAAERRLTRATRQVSRLSALIAQVLDASGTDSSRLGAIRESTDFSVIVRDCVEASTDLAARAGCSVQMDIEPGVRVSGDDVRLEQLVRNLLSNALKYGCDKPVVVSLRRAERHAEFVVRDHGIGISQEDQARIFERFSRAEAASHFGGLGLGLWIARQVVEVHGGVVRVDSAPGQGASFIVSLPLES